MKKFLMCLFAAFFMFVFHFRSEADPIALPARSQISLPENLFHEQNHDEEYSNTIVAFTCDLETSGNNPSRQLRALRDGEKFPCKATNAIIYIDKFTLSMLKNGISRPIRLTSNCSGYAVELKSISVTQVPEGISVACLGSGIIPARSLESIDLFPVDTFVSEVNETMKSQKILIPQLNYMIILPGKGMPANEEDFARLEKMLTEPSAHGMAWWAPPVEYLWEKLLWQTRHLVSTVYGTDSYKVPYRYAFAEPESRKGTHMSDAIQKLKSGFLFSADHPPVMTWPAKNVRWGDIPRAQFLKYYVATLNEWGHKEWAQTVTDIENERYDALLMQEIHYFVEVARRLRMKEDWENSVRLRKELDSVRQKMTEVLPVSLDFGNFDMHPAVLSQEINPLEKIEPEGEKQNVD